MISFSLSGRPSLDTKISLVVFDHRIVVSFIAFILCRTENYKYQAHLLYFMATITDPRLPEYVRKNLEYFLDHEAEDPERFEPLVDALCRRWGI